jgi:hypothetical protein
MDWRAGMLICIVVGFLADTIRKVVPDQPVYLVVVVGLFVAAVSVGFIRQYGFVRPNIDVLRSAVRLPLMLFMLWLAFEAIVSFARYGSVELVGIGLLSYLAPVPAFLIAYYYGLRVRYAVDFIKFYVFFAVAMLTGVFLSYFGVESPLLEEVGAGVTIYIPGGILESYSGFLRSTEGAAWHSATAVSLILVLTISGAVRWPKMLVAVLLILLILAGLLTGRRKMLMEVVIFAGVYGGMLLYFRREAGKLIVVGCIMASLLGVVAAFGITDRASKHEQRLEVYLARGATVFGDADDRFAKLGIASVGWALDRYGLLGGGLGVASQGGQHFGGGAARFGGAGEGGLGKIAAELGMPGLVLALWIAVAVMAYMARLILNVAQVDDPVVPFLLGLVAVLIANVPLFIVATQVFGDLFVLLLLGWISGFAISISTVVLSANGGRLQSFESRSALFDHAR